MIPLAFPEFNLFSMPLLILVLQGYIFACLLLRRFIKKRVVADFILAVLLIITGYHRSTYIIGFMGWYDTFRNTKVNYFLLNLTLAIGPLIYFYVKSATNPGFKFQKKHCWHFIPIGIYLFYKMVLWLHDRSLPGYDLQQNGEWMIALDINYIGTLIFIFGVLSMTIYLMLSIQVFLRYRSNINKFYADAQTVKLTWLANFLGVFTFLFVFGLALEYIDSEIVDLHWKQFWWIHFLSSMAMVYLGIYGFFIDLSKLGIESNIDEKVGHMNKPQSKDDSELNEIKKHLSEEKSYLNPDLTLKILADELKLNTLELSSIINKSGGLNFNDFINRYRVEEVKENIKAGKAETLSLLGIAYESGFNSKATFNRSFKKYTGLSPSEYVKSL